MDDGHVTQCNMPPPRTSFGPHRASEFPDVAENLQKNQFLQKVCEISAGRQGLMFPQPGNGTRGNVMEGEDPIPAGSVQGRTGGTRRRGECRSSTSLEGGGGIWVRKDENQDEEGGEVR